MRTWLAAAILLAACGGDSFSGSTGTGGGGGDGARGGDGGRGGGGGAVASSSASTGGEGGRPALPSCAEQYGTTPGFFLCSETPAECTFSAVIDPDLSCFSVCESRGGECVAAFSNPDGEQCMAEGEVPCTKNDYDILCLCTVGCAGNPPCAVGKKCVGGTCT